MKRILFVISTLNTGGAQKCFANLSMVLPKEYECDFLLNDAENITFPYKGNIIDLGFKPQKDKTDLGYIIKVSLARYKKLKELKNSGKYVACISGLTSANAMNAITGGKNTRVIISIHNLISGHLKDMKWYKAAIDKFMQGIAIKKAQGIVAVSEGAAEELCKVYSLSRNRVSVIENGIDIESISRMSDEEIDDKEREWFESHRAIVTAGRLTAPKGFWHLIRAFSLVVKEVPNAGLMILGDGSMMEYLKKIAKELGISDNIYFAGFKNNPYAYMKRAEVFAVSSLHEGFCNVLAEAVCLQKACVSTAFIAGAKEILGPDYGIITSALSGRRYEGNEPLEEAEIALSKAIVSLLADNDKREFYEGRSRERMKTLDLNCMVEDWIKVIEG